MTVRYYISSADLTADTKGAGVLQLGSRLSSERQADREHGSRNGEAPGRQNVTKHGRQSPQSKG